MKYKPMYWWLVRPIMKKSLTNMFSKHEANLILRRAKKSYKELLALADGIGDDNPMAYNFYLAALFISLYTGNPNKISKADIKVVIQDFFKTGVVIRLVSKTDFNRPTDIIKARQSMVKRLDWINHNKTKYPKAWDFYMDDSHEQGYAFSFTKCPIASFFKEQGLGHMTDLVCEIDHLSVTMAHGKLIRENTIAGGDDICDFWIVGDKVKL